MTDLSRRLRIAPGQRVFVLNAPAGYELSSVDGAVGSADVVQLFALDRAQLERDAAAALEALRPGGPSGRSTPARRAGASLT